MLSQLSRRGKWLEHRGSDRKCLYGQGNVYNARNRLIIGVRSVLELISRWTMMDDDMSIISSKISYESVHGQFRLFVFFSKLARKKPSSKLLLKVSPVFSKQKW